LDLREQVLRRSGCVVRPLRSVEAYVLRVGRVEQQLRAVRRVARGLHGGEQRVEQVGHVPPAGKRSEQLTEEVIEALLRLIGGVVPSPGFCGQPGPTQPRSPPSSLPPCPSHKAWTMAQSSAAISAALAAASPAAAPASPAPAVTCAQSPFASPHTSTFTSSR